MYGLHPTRWYYPTAASSGVPCRWEGWVNFGIGGTVWFVVDLFGE